MSTATEPIPVYTGTDFYVPHFEVMVGDRRQPGSVVRDVIQVTYRDSVEQIDSFELTVNNWDAAARKFKYHDRRLFDPGQPVEIALGYLGAAGGGLRTVIRGEITDLRATFPAGGQPTLVVGGQNVLHRFRSEQRSERHQGPTYTAIARRVCGRLGVPFVVNPRAQDAPVLSLTQENEFDIVFLMRLARLAGYELAVTEAGGATAITFGPPAAAGRVTYRLSYGRSLIEFQPTLSFAHQVAEVVVRGWDPVKGEAIDVSVGGGNLTDKIKPGSKNPARGRKEVIADQPVRDAQAARDLGRATLARVHNEAVKASGSVVGLPDLRAGAQVHVDGLGERFNGRYFVTATTHTLGPSGYVTQFECRLEALSGRSDGEALGDTGGAA